MSTSNAERQAKWRAKRNAEAKLAEKVLAPHSDGKHFDRETAILNLLNTEGAEWTAGFVDALRRWKPGKIAKRRRRKAIDQFGLLNIRPEDYQLPDHSAEIQAWAEECQKQPVNLEGFGDVNLATTWVDPAAQANAEEIVRLKAKLKKERARNRAARQTAANPPPASSPISQT